MTPNQKIQIAFLIIAFLSLIISIIFLVKQQDIRIDLDNVKGKVAEFDNVSTSSLNVSIIRIGNQSISGNESCLDFRGSGGGIILC